MGALGAKWVRVGATPGFHFAIAVCWHNTIARFRSKILASEAGQYLLRQPVILLKESGLLSMAAVFVDGTKLEENASKYSFAWRKSAEKIVGKVQAKIHEALPEIRKNLDICFCVPEKIELRHLKKLYAKTEKADVVWFTGRVSEKRNCQKCWSRWKPGWPNSGSIPMTCISAGTGTATAKPGLHENKCSTRRCLMDDHA